VAHLSRSINFEFLPIKLQEATLIKKKVLLLPILILVFLAFNLSLEAELKKVLSIGSNQPDYLL